MTIWAIEERAFDDYRKMREGILKNPNLVKLVDDQRVKIEAQAGDGEAAPTSNASLIRRAKKDILVYEIKGVMKDEIDIFDEIFGLAISYDSITEDFEAIKANAAIKGVLLSVTSPGGVAVGFQDAISAIESTGKPIVAHVKSQAYSMAYDFLVASDYIVASDSARIGSIGVLYKNWNIYDALVKNDIKPITIRRGKDKAKPGMDEPYAEADYKEIDQWMNESYDSFVAHVAQRRGITVDDVKSTEAGTFNVIDAQNRKLIDTIGNKKDALQYLRNLIDTGGQPAQQALNPLISVRSMTNENTITGTEAAKTEELPKLEVKPVTAANPSQEELAGLKAEFEVLKAENVQLKAELMEFKNQENERQAKEKENTLACLKELGSITPSLLAVYSKCSNDELKAIYEEQKQVLGNNSGHNEKVEGSTQIKPIIISTPGVTNQTAAPNLSEPTVAYRAFKS